MTRNEGARISDAGYTKLVDRSINDEVLAICVSMRKDIPQEHFNALIAKASEVVFEKLAASNPHAVYEVHRVLADITGQDPAGQPKAKRDYREAAAQFDVVRRSGAPLDPVVCEYAQNGKFEEPVAALSALSGAPDFALILAEAAGLSRSTVKQICILRRKGPSAFPRRQLRTRAAVSIVCRPQRHNGSCDSTTNATPRWRTSTSWSRKFARRKAPRAS